MLAHTIKHFPSETAMSWKQDDQLKHLSYQELWSIIRDFAMGLEKIGIRPKSKVAIFADNQPRWIISDLAILSLGAISVPIDPKTSSEGVHAILKDAEVEAIIFGNPDQLRHISPLPHQVKYLIHLNQGDMGFSDILNFEKCIQIGRTTTLETEDWVYYNIQSHDPATITYSLYPDKPLTGAMLSHGQILQNLHSISYLIPISTNDFTYSPLTLADPFARMMGYLIMLKHGATLIFQNPIKPIIEQLHESCPTILIGTPTLFNELYDHLYHQIKQASWFKQKQYEWALQVAQEYITYTRYGQNRNIPSFLTQKYMIAEWLILSKLRQKIGGKLRFLLSTGDPLAAEKSQLFTQINVPLIETYCLPECTSLITCNYWPHIKPETVGKAIPGVELDISTNGKLLVKSPSMMIQYYNQPDKTRQKIKNGWVQTDILAHIDAEGYVKIM
jgi:long-chain acyl-CoA synthetase